jgi:hypothetical protein
MPPILRDAEAVPSVERQKFEPKGQVEYTRAAAEIRTVQLPDLVADLGWEF